MPATTLPQHWTPARPTDLGGPEHLAMTILDFRQWHASKGLHEHGNISEHGLRLLIQLAYLASQAPEEGRFPQFRLFSPAAGSRREVDELTILRFPEPRPICEVNGLRRLAPAAASHDRALLIEEIDPARPQAAGSGHVGPPHGIVAEIQTRLRGAPAGGAALFCTGIMATARPPQFAPIQPTVWPRPEGTMIRVDGPGELMATESGLSFSLSRGRLQTLSAVHQVDVVRHWLAEEADRIWRKLASPAADPAGTPADAAAPASRTPLQMLLGSLWSEVLADAQQTRHGATFLVLEEPRSAPLLRRTPVSGLHLGRDVETYWRSRRLLDAQRPGSDPRELLQSCQREWDRLHARCRALASLSAVDGCVVLSRELAVESFGAMIELAPEAAGERPSRETAAAARWPVRDEHTNELVPQLLLAGTRHASACHLCRVMPGAMAFVISQDGELTLFHGTKQGVRRAGALSPVAAGDW